MGYSVSLFLVTFGLCGLLMLWVTLFPPGGWKPKTAILIVFLIFTTVGGALTYWQEQENARERGIAQAADDQRAAEMKQMKKQLLKLDLYEKEKQESQVEKQARDKRRQNTFLKPLGALIDDAQKSIEMANSFPGSENAAHFRPGPMKWYFEGVALLTSKCSEVVARSFSNPIKDALATMEFPTSYLNTTDGIIHFYQIRVEVLKDLRRDNALLCDK